MFRKIVLASICLLLLAACVPASEPETTAGDQISIERDTDTTPANTDAATKLAMRLLAPRYPGAPDIGEVQLLVGEVPADFALPMPDSVEIVGSLVRGTEGTEVVLDSSQPAEFILNYYTEEMPKAGWETFEEPQYGGGGFVPGDIPQNKTFCNDEADLVMWMTALDLEDAPTDIHLSINPSHGYSPCNQGTMGGPPPNDPYALMPALVPPAGVRQIGGGGGGSGMDGMSSNATLETDMATADLLVHYNVQLKEAGWLADSEDANSPVSWSTWTFSDSDGNSWRGLFLATQLDDEHRTVYVEIMRLK